MDILNQSPQFWQSIRIHELYKQPKFELYDFYEISSLSYLIGYVDETIQSNSNNLIYLARALY